MENVSILKIASPSQTRLGKGVIVLIDSLLFLATLLIGADKFAFEVFGVAVRIDQFILLLLALIMLASGCFKLVYRREMVFFLASAFLSVLFSFNKIRGAAFFLSIVYNYIFVFCLYKNYIDNFGIGKFIKIFRATLYVDIFILLIQVGLKMVFNKEIPFMPSYGEFRGVHRFALWFYEPSYLATYLSFFFAFALFELLFKEKKSYIIDLLLCLLGFLLSTSTSGFISIALVFLFAYIAYLFKGKRSSVKFGLPMLVIIGLVIFRFAFSNVYDVFVNRIFSEGLNSASGGRMEQYGETLSVFLSNPIFGVGPGNYGAYLGIGNDYVPSNVTLELMATLGILGMVSYYLISLGYILRIKKVFITDKKTYMSLLFALIIFTIVLQFNQGYLRLYHWMYFGILEGVLSYSNKKKSAVIAFL